MSRVLAKSGEPVTLDPQRLFSRRQRLQILLACEGCCARCRTKLGQNWQADHVVAWNQGGRTDVSNGEAICPVCYGEKNGKDTTRAAKTKRQAKMMLPTEPPKRPIPSPGWNTQLRRRVDGKVERR